ncbi:MAG: hypothetical protein ABFE13_00175 [Phycisphaerales bacterium]
MMRAKLLAILMALVLTSGVTLADLQSEATAHVYVEVVANVAVAVQTAVVDLGNVQTGEFSGEVVFRVDANMERLDLQAAVTPLYKGDSLTAESVIQIAEGAGVAIACENGSEIEAGDGILAFDGATSINGFPALLTEVGTFESGQNGHFSQNVTATFTWDQTDPEMPMGEYSGFCMLRGMILP